MQSDHGYEQQTREESMQEKIDNNRKEERSKKTVQPGKCVTANHREDRVHRSQKEKHVDRFVTIDNRVILRVGVLGPSISVSIE